MGLGGNAFTCCSWETFCKGLLSTLWSYPFHPLPTQNLKLKQNAMWENLAEKNVDDASSEPSTLSLEALQQSHPLL